MIIIINVYLSSVIFSVVGQTKQKNLNIVPVFHVHLKVGQIWEDHDVPLWIFVGKVGKGESDYLTRHRWLERFH